MKRDFWNRYNRNRLKLLCMRFADGGSSGTETPAEPPAAVPPAPPAAPAQPPKETAPDKAFTAEDLESAKAAAVEAYQHHLEEAKDYNKMTAEEKVAFLEQQRADDKIAQYAATKLSAQDLPLDLLPFIKGGSEAETDERLKAFKTAYDKGVQAGVDKRFQANGYLPRTTAAGDAGKAAEKRSRGVSVK